MKKSIVLIPLPSLIKNSFVRSFSLSLCVCVCVCVCVHTAFVTTKFSQKFIYDVKSVCTALVTTGFSQTVSNDVTSVCTTLVTTEFSQRLIMTSHHSV